MMAQQNHEESIETSSDFMECKMARTPTEESEKDVQGYFADPEKLKEFLSCVKCKQEFDHDTHKPFLLPCSDAVCKSCTQAISSLESQSYECHKCHCDHICFQNDKTNLQTDSTRELVTKIFRLTSGKTNLACEMCTNNKLVSHRCFECSLFICTDCVKLHSILKALGSHSFVEINRLLTTKMENLKRVSCEENAAENACETTIEVFRKKLDLIVKQARKSLAELENIDTKSQQDLQKVQEEIKTHFREVKKAIEEREKMLYDAAATQLSKKQICIESEKVQLNLFIGLCEQASYYGEFSEINNHEYFLDIAKTIQSRLDTSERHFSKNKVSMDAMKFSTQPEFSFKTAVNSIGKLSVSKAISSKSKVEVKPAFCHIGQEVQFQVQLFSSTGKIVVDEDVYLCLMVNRKIFKNIKCAIDESISSFIGIWVPGEPMKLSWIVVSNDITLATLNGVLDVNEPNESICDDEEKQISEVVMTPKTATKCNKDVSGKASDSRFTGVKTRENTSSYIEGSLPLKVINQKKKYTTRVKSINMSEKDFRKMLFFGDQLYWFKEISLKLYYDGKTLCIQSDVDDDRVEKLQNLFKSMQMMSADDFVIHCTDINVLLVMQEVERLKPKVCMIRIGNKIEIIAENYIDLVETKSLLQQKCSSEQISRRDGCSFAEQQDNRSQLIAETNRTPPNFQTSYNLDKRMRIQALEVNTKKGLMIKIYAGSITRLDVDCIVCASNDQLTHGGGVAAAICEAAGYEFDKESRDYIQKHGPIPVGRCFVTSAGNLHYKCVIHTVGPRWSDYSDKNRCLQDLQESVEVTFRLADKMGLQSIAIPAISSGMFAVPRKNCIEEYYRAAMSFSSKYYKSKGLQQIHFVDRDESMVRAMQETFQQKESFTSTLDKSENPGKTKDLPSGGADYSAQSVMPDTNSYTIVHVSEKFQVKIYLGNITDVPADAIVCPQDEYLSSKDNIAMEICKKFPCKSKSSNKKMNYGDISSESLHGNSPWKFIIHAVAPIYDCNNSKRIVKFGAVLKNMIQNIIEAADEVSVGSVAIPLLGAGKEDFKTPVDLCASSFFKAVMDRKSKYPSLKEIYLVLDDDDMEYTYLKAFKYTCKITPRAVSKVGNSNIQNFGKTLTGCRKNDENCCICMDKLTNPKRLQKCGHTFCKECIEQYFQYKPACPSCGQIYGKMTGDQPPGSIMIRNDYKQKLEGFPDSKGCIILTYTFHNGRQGPEHPEQGQWYKGINRSGYVPNNEKGRLVAKLLNVAFSRRLVFTIGRSRTTGQEGVITWNDIHHKTRPYGGPAQFGYPDPTYLDRVLEELDAKGVTKESADDPEEYKEYSKLF